MEVLSIDEPVRGVITEHLLDLGHQEFSGPTSCIESKFEQLRLLRSEMRLGRTQELTSQVLDQIK